MTIIPTVVSYIWQSPSPIHLSYVLAHLCSIITREREREKTKGTEDTFLPSCASIILERERECVVKRGSHVGSIQQLDRVATGRTSSGRQPDSVAEDQGGGAGEPVP